MELGKLHHHLQQRESQLLDEVARVQAGASKMAAETTAARAVAERELNRGREEVIRSLLTWSRSLLI